MSNKLQDYVQMAGQTAAEITKNSDNWIGFLATASKLYRYSFPDQLLIHAQRPQATACADYDLWNKRMRRYVRRGSRGIGLVNVNGNGRPALRYVFDVADTGKRNNACSLYLWKYRDEYKETVAKAVEKSFGIAASSRIELQLCNTAVRMSKDFWKNHRQDIVRETEGSLLEGLDERSLRVKFCESVAYSITCILLMRCGFDPENYFKEDIFQDISDFNTQRIIKIIGHAVSQASGEVLHQIAIAIFGYERKKQAVQSATDTGKQRSSTNYETDNQKKPSSFVISVDKGKTPQPSVRDIYEHYKPIVKEFLLKDTAYQNACRNSDLENAILEGIEAVKRAAFSVKDLSFMKLYYDLNEFHNTMQHEAIAETYPVLSNVQEQGQDTEEPDQKESIIDEQESDTAEKQERDTAVEKMDSEDTVPDNTEQESIDDDTENIETEQDNSASNTNPESTNQNPYIIGPVIISLQPDSDTDEPNFIEPQSIPKVPVVPELSVSNLQNFHITDDNLGIGGPKAKFAWNMSAIIVLKQIEFEKRNATPDEQVILSRYVGWGGIPDVFGENKAGWEKEYKELKETLTQEEYDSARASVLNAHYTSPVVIKAIYKVIANMGFTAGNILEPSCGIGNFFGLLPEEMSKSKLYGVELDSITGRIAKQLYPKSKISVCGYEKTNFPKDFFDVAVGNVPFGQYQVNDPDYNRLGFSIHNYFFAKSLDQVRPGGILAFVTSRYMMDAKDTKVREYMAERADLLGAVRLPNNAFKANAGTDVVSDIIFLQKRNTPNIELPAWTHTEQNEDGYAINRYFIDNPEMVLGHPASESTQYGRQDYTVLPIPAADLADQLCEAISHIHGKYQDVAPMELAENSQTDTLPADPDVKNYSFTLVDGDVYYRENSVMTKTDMSATVKSRIKGMIKLRDCVHGLIALQMDEYATDSAITEKQAELNKLYDGFTCQYGLINARPNRLAFERDSSYYLLCSLEILDDNGNLERKADMFTKRTIKQNKAITHVDTASEALTVSIGERACVDLAFMSNLTGKDESELIQELHGVIYKDPANNTWKTADEYLSGNVRRKLRLAQKYAEQNPEYQINVDALTAAQPKDLDASEIEVRIGATWIDKSYIQQFMHETLNTPSYLHRKVIVNYSKITAEWAITNKNSIPYNDVAAYTTYGTSRANAYRILEDSLNLRDVRIYDTIEDEDGKEKRVLNAKETTLASQKQQALRDAFRDWIFKDPERR